MLNFAATHLRSWAKLALAHTQNPPCEDSGHILNISIVKVLTPLLPNTLGRANILQNTKRLSPSRAWKPLYTYRKACQ